MPVAIYTPEVLTFRLFENTIIKLETKIDMETSLPKLKHHFKLGYITIDLEISEFFGQTNLFPNYVSR